MVELGAVHFVYNNLPATEQAIRSFREFYPDAPYTLINDGGVDHHHLVKKYNVVIHDYPQNLGYFGKNGVWGYNKLDVMTYLRRFYMAMMINSAKYCLYMEDDVRVINPITIPMYAQVMGHGGHGNAFSQELLNIIAEECDVTPNLPRYGAGGGTIFNAHTFIANFGRLQLIFHDKFERMHQAYPQMGWMDCFMDVCYFLLGCERINSEKLFNIYPATGNYDLNSLKSQYEIVHGYKI